MDKLISIVITTYKRPIDILTRAIVSVLRQSYSNIEVLVINDCPEDKVLSNAINEVINKFNDSRLTYMEVEQNGGACKARNFGLARANGVYIAFMDDDDEWFPGKLERQAKALDEKPYVGLVYSSLLLQQADGSWLVGNKNPRPKDPLKELLAVNYVGPTSSPLMRTSHVLSLDGFDSLMPSCQDYDLWVRIVQEADVEYIDEPLVRYYYSNDSTFKGNGEKYFAGINRMFEKYKSLYEVYPESLVTRANSQAIDFLISFKSFEKYAFYKKLAFKTSPISVDNYLFLPKRVVKRFISRIGQKQDE